MREAGRVQFLALRPALDAIRDYGRRHKDLEKSHHFLFALPLDGFDFSRPVDFVLMGVNPGETDDCWQSSPGSGHEESFEIDFHKAAEKVASGRKNWVTRVRNVVPPGNVTLTDLFFWSSKNGDEFKKRFGKIEESVHVNFCTSQNVALLEVTRPKAVIFSGAAKREFVAKQFNLKPFSIERCCHCDQRIADVYDDGIRKWFFVPHLSASRGPTKAQRLKVKDLIAASVGS